MRMFQQTSRAHFIGLILHGSVIVQLTVVNALPQPSNVQERQFAIQMEHARVNIRNLNDINDNPNKISVHSNIMFGINPISFLFYTRTHSSDNATTTIKSLQNHEISTW